MRHCLSKGEADAQTDIVQPVDPSTERRTAVCGVAVIGSQVESELFVAEGKNIDTDLR